MADAAKAEKSEVPTVPLYRCTEYIAGEDDPPYCRERLGWLAKHVYVCPRQDCNTLYWIERGRGGSVKVKLDYIDPVTGAINDQARYASAVAHALKWRVRELWESIDAMDRLQTERAMAHRVPVVSTEERK